MRDADYWWVRLKQFDAANPGLYWDDPRQAQRERIIQNLKAAEWRERCETCKSK